MQKSDVNKLHQVLARHDVEYMIIGKGAARRIKAGEYEFSGKLSPAEIINKLIRGERKYYNVLLPEDINAREIAQRLLSFKLLDEKEFMNQNKASH